MKLYLRFLLPPLPNINVALFSWFLRARFHSVYNLRLYLRFYFHHQPPGCSLLPRVLCALLLQGLAHSTKVSIVSSACGTPPVYSDLGSGDPCHRFVRKVISWEHTSTRRCRWLCSPETKCIWNPVGCRSQWDHQNYAHLKDFPKT